MGISPFPPKRFPLEVPSRGGAEYRLIGGPLGKTPQSEVYKAEKTSQKDLRLALKLCDPKAPDGRPLSEEELSRRLCECRDHARRLLIHGPRSLAPPCEVLDLREYRSYGWPPLGIVMESFDVTLSKVLKEYRAKQKKLPSEVVAHWGEGLVAALVALEKAELIHRDIVPQNIGLRRGEMGPLGYRGPGDPAYLVPSNLLGTELVLFDFDASFRRDQPAVREVFQDPPERWLAPRQPYKDPRCYRYKGDSEKPRPTSAADWYAVGRVIQALIEVMEHGWYFSRAAKERRALTSFSQRCLK
jgi:serine/threonine protein kinase